VPEKLSTGLLKEKETNLDHAKTLLVVSSGDFEDITRKFIAEAIALNGLRQESEYKAAVAV
jgi:hypothetical protein